MDRIALRPSLGYKVRFFGLLGVGWLLSVFWFCLHLILTQTHENDAGIVNYSGRLRHQTDRVALAILSRKYFLNDAKPTLMNGRSPFEDLDSIVQGLLRGDNSYDLGDVPEILDNDVKAALKAWIVEHVNRLRSTWARVSELTPAEVSQAVHAVDEATRAVDIIVDTAQVASSKRIRVLVLVGIIRAMTGAVWSACVAISFGRLWRPYVDTYNKLQLAEQECTSLLRAAFDAVVPISGVPPFNVIASNDKFDHLMGRSMDGKSLLSCAEDPREEAKLVHILSLAHAVDEQQRYNATKSFELRWWNLFPQKAQENMPVAAMINTCWLVGQAQEQQSVLVEVLVVNRHYSVQGDRRALLSVRKVSSDESARASTDFIDPRYLDIVQIGRSAHLYSEPANSMPAYSTATRSTDEGYAMGAMSPNSARDDTPPPSTIWGITESMVPQRQAMIIGMARHIEEALENAFPAETLRELGQASSGTVTP